MKEKHIKNLGIPLGMQVIKTMNNTMSKVSNIINESLGPLLEEIYVCKQDLRNSGSTDLNNQNNVPTYFPW